MGQDPKLSSSSFKFTVLLYSNVLLSSIYLSNKDLGVPAMLLVVEAALAWMFEFVSKPWLGFPSKPRNYPGSHDTAHPL